MIRDGDKYTADRSRCCDKYRGQPCLGDGFLGAKAVPHRRAGSVRARGTQDLWGTERGQWMGGRGLRFSYFLKPLILR